MEWTIARASSGVHAAVDVIIHHGVFVPLFVEEILNFQNKSVSSAYDMGDLS